MRTTSRLIAFLFFIYGGSYSYGQAQKLNSKYTVAEDALLAEKLRIDLQFDLKRRKGFSGHHGEVKVFDREREKGLSIYLEEEERWNRLREKGLFEQRKNRAQPIADDGPEFLADQKLKKEFDLEIEIARKKHVRTKNSIVNEIEPQIPQTEDTEMGLLQARPRYDLRLRGKNKWVNSGKKLLGTGSSSSSGYSPFDSAPPPAPDFSSQPVDNFDDLPPPPPPIPYDNFDNTQNIDQNFNDIPPPPPPPSDPAWDF